MIGYYYSFIRNEILIVKDFAKLEKENKTLPETLKHHEADIILQKEKQRKVMQEHLNAVRRKDQLETELNNAKQQLQRIKKISENKYDYSYDFLLFNSTTSVSLFN